MAKNTAKKQTSGAETHKFGAQVDKILQLMIHSLYANRDIFLRELISNASDACDKLRYNALAKPELLEEDAELCIRLEADEKNQTLTVIDNGIGMSKEDLMESLGTIASSGTQRFLESMTGDSRKDMKLIGQFGVGFYSAFMVADSIEVTSRKAGEKKAHLWVSSGNGEYTIEEAADKQPRGTRIVLRLKKDCEEFTDKHHIGHIVRTYSDHIAFPVSLKDSEGKTETLNTGAALWARPKADISDEQYNEFYHHVAHAGDTPWLTLHNSVEGTLSYTNLLFVPSRPPFDLFHPDRQTSVKLYVKRVFITDQADLLPRYLRFVKGIVDSDDLPLNISRETLQHSAMIQRIKQSVTKRILSELKKKAEHDAEGYKTFWDQFGAVLKEGLCEPLEAMRDSLLDVCRFRSTQSEGEYISLAQYIERMKPEQKKIYYLTADNADISTLKQNPQLEGFNKKGIEVLLLTDAVDGFWVNVVYTYREHELGSVTVSGIELEGVEADASEENKSQKEEKENPAKLNKEAEARVLAFFKETLGNKVRDVVASKKLDSSPVCLTRPEGAMDSRMERFLMEQNQLKVSAPKVLEINPSHPLITRLAEGSASDDAKELAILLFEQACVIEGELLPDPGGFARRMNNFLAKVA